MNKISDKHISPTSHFNRRRFLQFCAASTLPVASGSTLLFLNGCGGNDQAGTFNMLAGSEIPVLNYPSTANISMQASKVEWVPGYSPKLANAWSYVISDSDENAVLSNHLGPTFNVRRGTPCRVTWHNKIPASQAKPGALETPPIHAPLDKGVCGNVSTQSAVGLVTHLHGARLQASSDGWPLTPMGFEGNRYGFASSAQFDYPNAQRSTMLWYHDHAMDNTGRHVHAGLAGVYFIRDDADDAILNLLGGEAQELLYVIQDRILSDDKMHIDYAAGMPDQDPLKRPEFLGDTIFINGHPVQERRLARRTLRLRLLNGSNARTYALALCDVNAIKAKQGQVWHSDTLRVIGADGGLISTSVQLQADDVLILAPGQRRDVLIDLGSLAKTITQLRLVNLSLRFTLDADSTTPEGIFTTFEESVFAPGNVHYDEADKELYEALNVAVSNILPISLIDDGSGSTTPTTAQVDQILASARNDDDFVWSNNSLTKLGNKTLGKNRLILLMSNTEGKEVDEAINGISGWSDVQIFEMEAGGNDWTIPFKLDLSTAQNPAAGMPATDQGYRLTRRSFFASESNPDILTAGTYPELHAPTIRCKAGTYERWYVANIGNVQPLTAELSPDMHPFHVHLVNMVVSRRWQLQDGESAQFQELPASALGLDQIARQDTILIPSNQLVELLVYIPAGYAGNFAYHCHLLEHEDMCMMSHFNVSL